MYGSTAAALNQVIRLFGLQFTVIGTFHEKVETFGQSEVERDTVLVPITVLRYFTPVERIDPLYVQVRSPAEVDRVAQRVQEILGARHRPGATYRVDTLTAILNAAKNISLILSLVLVLVSAITLVISGNRDHEHHAGDGDGADARDRSAAGGGGIGARDPAAVPHRGHDGEPHRRAGGYRGGSGDSAERGSSSPTSGFRFRRSRSLWPSGSRAWWAWCSACFRRAGRHG